MSHRLKPGWSRRCRAGEHCVVGDGGTADALAAGAGGLVAFQGAVADVLAFHTGQGGQQGEHDPGQIVPALQFAGAEFQTDAGGPQIHSQRLDGGVVRWTGRRCPGVHPAVDQRIRPPFCPILAADMQGYPEPEPVRTRFGAVSAAASRESRGR
jgi:hypothetical protein